MITTLKCYRCSILEPFVHQTDPLVFKDFLAEAARSSKELRQDTSCNNWRDLACISVLCRLYEIMVSQYIPSSIKDVCVIEIKEVRNSRSFLGNNICLARMQNLVMSLLKFSSKTLHSVLFSVWHNQDHKFYRLVSLSFIVLLTVSFSVPNLLAFWRITQSLLLEQTVAQVVLPRRHVWFMCPWPKISSSVSANIKFICH